MHKLVKEDLTIEKNRQAFFFAEGRSLEKIIFRIYCFRFVCLFLWNLIPFFCGSVTSHMQLQIMIHRMPARTIIKEKEAKPQSQERLDKIAYLHLSDKIDGYRANQDG
jgi:hypothetical protein